MNGSRSVLGPLLMVALIAASAVWAMQAALARPGLGPDLSHATMLALILQVAALGLAAALPLHAGDLDLSVGASAMLGVTIGVVRVGSEDMFPLTLVIAALAGGVMGVLIGLLSGGRRPVALVSALVGGMVLVALSRADRHLAVTAVEQLTLLELSTALFGAAVVASVLVVMSRGRHRTVGPGPGSGLGGRVVAIGCAGAIGAAAGAMMAAQGVRDAGFNSLGLFLVAVPLLSLVVGGQLFLAHTSRLRVPAAAAGALLTAAVCIGSTQPSDNLVPGLVVGLPLAAVAAVLWRAVLRRRSPFTVRQQRSAPPPGRLRLSSRLDG